LVYLNYSQTELDAQYNQATLVPDISKYLKYWNEAGDAARRSLNFEKDIAYGDMGVELLDIFRADSPSAPIHIHIHGGAWRQLSKEHAHYPAPYFVSAGAIFIALNFGLAPEFSLNEIVDQVRRAVNWVWKNADSFGGNKEKIFLSGISSGAHLAACVLSGGWHENYKLPENVVKGAVLASGPYDLEPVRLSARNDYLKLSQIDADRNNSLKHIPKQGPAIIVCWGEGELEEFQRQGQAYASAWKSAGNSCQSIILKGLNHFDVANEFGRGDSELIQGALKQMALVAY